MSQVLISPVALALGPIEIHWYGLLIGLGALLGMWAAILEGKRSQIPPSFFVDLLLIGAPSAIIAARIYYVAFRWDYYGQNPGEIIAIWGGGLAIHGALIGALIAGYFYVRAKGYPFIRIIDISAVSLLIGQIIGRWGNFVNQEAHGGPVDPIFLRETLRLPEWIVSHMEIDSGIFYHPTFLYESIWNIIGLVIILFLRRWAVMRAGEIFMFYLVWYSIGRFYIEGLRTDSLAIEGMAWLASVMDFLWTPMGLIFEPGDMAYGTVRAAQLIGLLIIIGAVTFVVVRRRRGLANTRVTDSIPKPLQKPNATKTERNQPISKKRKTKRKK